MKNKKKQEKTRFLKIYFIIFKFMHNRRIKNKKIKISLTLH
jgi:hypothetical protein